MTIKLKSDGKKDLIIMCSGCCGIQKTDESWLKIESNPNYWNNLANEYTLSKNKGISHSLCSPCAKKLYPELYE